jgi:hypothetical protein
MRDDRIARPHGNTIAARARSRRRLEGRIKLDRYDPRLSRALDRLIAAEDARREAQR